MLKFKSLFLNKYWRKLWWKYCKGPVIQISVPSNDGVIPMSDFDEFLTEKITYLETHVGIMRYDWDIRHNFIFDWMVGLLYVERDFDTNLQIKFRKKKEKHASICRLMWS